MEVGRSDGVYRKRLPFFEKLGALILAKSPKQEAYWWVLEKVPAILMRRLGFRFPQMDVAVGYFGDITKLRPTESAKHFLTWPKYETDMWETRPEPGAKPGSQATVFALAANNYADYRDDILNDPEIMSAIGPTETVLELTKSRTMGHHVAILLDISCDGRGGTTYLANSVMQAVGPHAGFEIVQDELRPGFTEQVRSDLLSRVAKAWKREAERIADNAGRDGWPIVAVHHDMFSGMQELPAPWLGAGTELDGITVRFVKSEAMSRLPWVSSV